MNARVRQGLGVLVVAALFGLLWLVTGASHETVPWLLFVAAAWLAIIGLVMLAVGLFQRDRTPSA